MKAIFALLFAVVIGFAAAQDSVCTSCEVVVQFVEYGVQIEGYNSTQIEASLEQLCALFPALESECDAVVTLYLDQIIQEITTGANPDTVCTQLDLCSSEDAPIKMKPTNKGKGKNGKLSKLTVV